jgi:cytochrome c
MEDHKNTIAGWILFAGIVSLGAWIVTGEAFHSEAPEKGGYTLPGAEAGGAGGGEAAKPVEFYLASADPAKGEEVFKKCAACHVSAQGGANGIGPNLWGVVGEPIGKGAGGFAFSEALSSKGGNWDWKSLDTWLSSPRAFAPGTKMTFAGLGAPQDRANVIAFLNSHGSNLPMPKAPAEAAPAAAGDKAAPAAGNTAAPAAENGAAPAPANSAAPAKK